MTDSSNTLFGADGEPFQWTDYARRLPEFRKRYPVADGWRVSVEHSNVLDTSPGLLEVLKCAITSNYQLAQLGLTSASCSAVVFTARLINKEGVCVEMASSRQVVMQHKQHECGETAAMNRLLAKLGFGGAHTFNEDEALDRVQQGIVGGAKSEVGGAQVQSQLEGSSVVTPTKRQKGVHRQTNRLVMNACEELGRLGETTSFPVLNTNEEAQAWLDKATRRVEELRLARPPEQGGSTPPTVQ